MSNHLTSHWIYSLTDYQHIFALPEQGLPKKMLCFPAGISSVNAELYAKGHYMVSGDELYHLSVKDMQNYVQKYLQDKIDYLRNHLNILSPPDEKTVSDVIQAWRHSTQLFLQDYEIGKKEGRYQPIVYDQLSQTNEVFDLLLCADLLFVNQAGESFSTRELMEEFCQLASEIRIFPLPPEKNTITNQLGPLMLEFQQRNYGVEVKAVTFPQRSDGHAMLRVWAKECIV